MTEAEQMLIAAADLNTQAATAERTERQVSMSPTVVRELAHWLEVCGRTVAQAGGIAATSTPAPIEYAHDIARTHLGEIQ